jgi:hypothetical protein
MIYSFSRLTSFWQCKYGWKLGYIDDAPQVGNGWSDAGTFCHEIMEAFNEGILDEKGALDTFDTWLDQDFEFPFPGYGYKSYKQIRPFFENLKRTDRIVASEMHFTYEIAGRRFQGYIDTVYDPDVYNVIDYKISKPFNRNLLKSKQRQMYLYAPAIFESYGKYPDKYVFVFFRDRSKSIVIDHNSKDLEKTLEWAEKTMELIEKEEEYKASPDQFFCNNLCGFRNICEFKI